MLGIINISPLRLLEAQLQSQSRQHTDELEALHTQIELLKDDLEKKQEILNHTMSLSPEAQVEYTVQVEITRLTNDNLVRYSTSPSLHTIIDHNGSYILFYVFFLLVGPQRDGGETGKE